MGPAVERAFLFRKARSFRVPGHSSRVFSRFPFPFFFFLRKKDRESGCLPLFYPSWIKAEGVWFTLSLTKGKIGTKKRKRSPLGFKTL